ncbi:hypothetical protein MBLNU457_5115t1 [Dothideomycetes sp. NU457]
MNSPKQKRLSALSQHTRTFSQSKRLLKMSSFRRSSRDVSTSALEALPVWKQNLWRAICSLGLIDGVFPTSHVDDDALLILEKSEQYAELFDWLRDYHESSLLPIMAPRFRVRCHEAVDIKECELYFALDKSRMEMLLRRDPPPRLPTTIFSNFDRNSIVEEWEVVDRIVSAASSSTSHAAESLTDGATQSSPIASAHNDDLAAPIREVTPATALGSHPVPGAWTDDETPATAEVQTPSPTMPEPGHRPKSSSYRSILDTPEREATRAATRMAPTDYRNARFLRPGFIFPISLNAVTYAQMTRGISEVDAHETRGPNGYEAVHGSQVTEGGWTENGKSVYEMGGYKQKKTGMKKVKGWWADAKSHLIEGVRNWGVPAST